MEDKIEVNEYVRFNNGEIGKVIDIKENPSRIVYSEYGEIGLISDIVKHSKQLIDLIECGDIVKIRTGLYSSFKYFVENEDDLLLLKEQVKQFWNIDKILTHEQFETNCYEIKEEE